MSNTCAADLKTALQGSETDLFECSVEASRRFNVVRQFNNDPSIPVMLLTTSVGGLGLNLTAADTVIFLEHDWNPMKDLQVRSTCTGDRGKHGFAKNWHHT